MPASTKPAPCPAYGCYVLSNGAPSVIDFFDDLEARLSIKWEGEFVGWLEYRNECLWFEGTDGTRQSFIPGDRQLFELDAPLIAHFEIFLDQNHCAHIRLLSESTKHFPGLSISTLNSTPMPRTSQDTGFIQKLALNMSVRLMSAQDCPETPKSMQILGSIFDLLKNKLDGLSEADIEVLHTKEQTQIFVFFSDLELQISHLNERAPFRLEHNDCVRIFPNLEQLALALDNLDKLSSIPIATIQHDT